MKTPLHQIATWLRSGDRRFRLPRRWTMRRSEKSLETCRPHHSRWVCAKRCDASRGCAMAVALIAAILSLKFQRVQPARGKQFEYLIRYFEKPKPGLRLE